MGRCTCCGKEDDKTLKLKLPEIGYGSYFDSCMDEYAVRFEMCEDCAYEVNRWVKKKLPDGALLADFWRCKVVQKQYDNGNTIYTYEEFEYEYLLMRVFLKFMPSLIFGDDYNIFDILKLRWQLYRDSK